MRHSIEPGDHYEEQTSTVGEQPRKPKPIAAADSISWRIKLRERIVRVGIRAVCGESSDIKPTAAADVPLVSAGLRFFLLRALEALGVQTIVARSALGHAFVCHIGDRAEFPYYHRRALAPELALCAGWLQGQHNPVIYDVGANVGFFATQLSQMLAGSSPCVYAFEPVPSTFAKLVHSVHKLGLEHAIHPIAAAVLDDTTVVDITCSNLNSLLSQIVRKRPHRRVTGRTAHVPAISLDTFCANSKKAPALIKVDAEGSEAAVFRGAAQILSSPSAPAIAFEFSPQMLVECGDSVEAVKQTLSGYKFFYVDDIVGQRKEYGSAVTCLQEMGWTCNLFAVPETDGCTARCASAFKYARRMIDVHN